VNASICCEANSRKNPIGGKKDEESSSKEKESNKEEVTKLKQLGAKTEI